MQILSNEDCAVYVHAPARAPEEFLRDADGDVTYFIHQGSGMLESDYGDLAYEPGDYVIVPKGTTHRLLPEGDDSFFLVIETGAEVEIPDRGLLGQHALFDPAVLGLPELKTEYDERPGELGGDGQARRPDDPAHLSLFPPSTSSAGAAR